MQHILGIDPGLANAGWGVIAVEGANTHFVDCGIIKTQPKQPLEKRLLLLHCTLSQLMERYQPVCVGMEETYSNSNARSSLMLAHARGAMLAAVAAHDIALLHISPRSIKQAISGYGAADKEQMRKMLQLLLPASTQELAQLRHDAVDAVAIALTTNQHYRVLRISGC